jgi:hypothetical protein
MKDGRLLLVVSHIFVVFDKDQFLTKLHLQESEVADYKWIDLELFERCQKSEIITINTQDSHNRYIIRKKLMKYPTLCKLAISSEVSSYRQAIDIGMNNKLFGTTLGIL